MLDTMLTFLTFPRTGAGEGQNDGSESDFFVRIAEEASILAQSCIFLVVRQIRAT